MTELSHWQRYSQHWQYIKSPLRPSAEDLQFVEAALESYSPPKTRKEPLSVLLLGVTQELSQRDWPSPVQLTSVDNEMAMIKKIWSTSTATRRVLCGDWLRLPFGQCVFSAALGDGSLNSIQFPEHHHRVSSELARVLRKDGIFIIRLFARPEKTELIDAVFSDIFNIESFHVFKWRLAMAVQGCNTIGGVQLCHIWDAYHTRFEHPKLVAATGWPLEEINTIDAYRNNNTVYSFPTTREVVEILSPQFQLIDQKIGNYQLAERCPTLIFKKR